MVQLQIRLWLLKALTPLLEENNDRVHVFDTGCKCHINDHVKEKSLISIFTATLLVANSKKPTQTLNLNFEMDTLICV